MNFGEFDRRPRLVFCGHIHESYGVQFRWLDVKSEFSRVGSSSTSDSDSNPGMATRKQGS